MASLVKRCRHPRPQWSECGCAWLIRQRVGGRDTYTNVGPDQGKAERALEALRRRPEETVTQAVDLWIAAKEREPGARPGSVAAWQGRAGHLRVYFGHTPVRAVRPEHLTELVADLLAADYAPATVQGVYAAMTSTLRHAQRRGVIASLPLPPDGPGIPTVRARSADITLADANRIVSDMPGRWGKVAELVLLTGLRWGEAVALERSDLDGDRLFVRRTRNRSGGTNPPKTRKGARVVPLSPRAQALLAEMDLPVQGDYRDARKALVAAMGDLHQPGMGWHTLRNAHADLLDAAGVTMREQAARMGHGENFAQTMAYRLGTEAKGDAAALDAARGAHAGPSEEPGGAVPLEAARRRRAARRGA